MSKASELLADFISYRLSDLYPSHWFERNPALFEASFMDTFSFKNFEKWQTIPISYLSEKEALLVGAARYFTFNENSYEACEAYFNSATAGSGDDVVALGHFALGILCLEQGMKFNEKSYYKQASVLFQKSLVNSKIESYSRLALIISLVAQGLWEDVAKQVLKVSRTHHRPGPLYKVLAGIYERIGLDGPKKFYQQKAKKAENSFGLFICA